MNIICHKKPAENYEESFPLGNGRLGARVFGNPSHEVFQLNEESVWSGQYIDRNNLSATEGIGRTRELIQQNRLFEAQECVFDSLTGLPENQSHYCSAGELHIDFYDAEHLGASGPSMKRSEVFDKAYSYKRELDLETGICTSSFSVESTMANNADFSNDNSGSSIAYTYESFVSAHADVLVIHISASIPKSIFFRLRIEGSSSKKETLYDDTLVMLNDEGIPYAVMVTAISSGGNVSVRGDNLIVENSDDVTIYVDVESAYRLGHYRRRMGNTGKRPLHYAAKCSDIALKKICFAMGTSYENLKYMHSSDFSSHFRQCSISNPYGEETPEITQWNYDRYCLISSVTGKKSVPALANGIWCSSKCGSRSQKYVLDEKYLPLPMGEIYGLEKSYASWHALIKNCFRHGRLTAERMYSCSGSVVHSSTDIWGDTVADGKDLRFSYDPTGAAYLSKVILDSYEYTLSKKYLRKHFRFLKHASRFFEDYLIGAEDMKKLVVSPGYSQNEQSAGVYLSAFSDVQSRNVAVLIRNTIKAMRYLGMNEFKDLSVELSALLSKVVYNLPDDFDLGSADENFFSRLNAMTSGVVYSTVEKETLVVHLLEKPCIGFESGRLENIRLRGNLLIDIDWKNGTLEKAVVRAKHGVKFLEKIRVAYKDRFYDARLVDGVLDLRNVLPTTL